MNHLWLTFAQSISELQNTAFPREKQQQHFLPAGARGLLTHEISKCVENYLDQHTYEYDGTNFALLSFINEPRKAGPWIPGLDVPKDNYGDDMGASSSKSPLNKSVGLCWGAENNTIGRIESMHGIVTQSRSELLDPKRGFILKAMSTTGVIDQNPHVDNAKPRGCSSVADAPTSKSRRGVSHQCTADNAPPTTASTRAQQSSRIAKPSRPKKAHKCPDCGQEFPFEARLKSHQAVHNKSQLKCKECDSPFGRDSSLKRHLNTKGACQKKKEAKRRNSSFQNSSAGGTRASSHHNFYEEPAPSTSSLMDGASVHSSPVGARLSTQNNFDQQDLWTFPPNANSDNVHYDSGYQSNIDCHQRPITPQLDPALWYVTYSQS